MPGKPAWSGSARKRPTPDQCRARLEMRLLSEVWNTLTDEQRQAWGGRARTNRRGGRWARAHLRNGRRLFFKVNTQRLALGSKPLTDPPGANAWPAIPLVDLVITNHAGRIALKLRLSQGSHEGVMVSSWHPCSPGAMVWRKFVRIGPLPAPVRGMCDITRQYVQKFGVPPVGTKIFVRIQQMSDYMGCVLHTTSAIVRGEEGWEEEQKTQ